MLMSSASCARKEPDNYFEVTYDQFLYSYWIKDRDGNILAEDTTSEWPHISQESEDIVCLWIQTGTGTLTIWSQYFNLLRNDDEQYRKRLCDRVRPIYW